MATDMINSLKIGSDVHVLSLPYGACTTSAGTTAKTVSVDNFSLETGAHVSIKFNNANTATSPTLNVNSTGAKTIYYRGAALTTASLAKQLQGIIEFVYNGTQWEVVGNLDTDTNTKSFTITANASDDDVVVLSGTNGSNAVTYSASHAKKGPSSGYTSGNTTTSISGSGGSGTIKIPQITVDDYGHVTAGADESVTITLPTIPALSETPSTDTSTIKPTGSAKSKTFTAITALGTNNHTITDTTTTYTLDLSEFATTAEISTAMVFKGSLGTNGTITSLPTAAAALVGDTYKVITAGTYANIAAKVGDVFVCSSKPEWVLIPSGDEPSGTVTSVATSGDIQGGTITTSGTISHKASGVTAGNYGPSSNATPEVGKTFSVPYFTVNANGHVTAASTKTITLPSDITVTTTGSGNAITAASFSNRTLTLTKGATFNNFSLPTRLAEYQASNGVVNNPDTATKTGFYYVKGSTNSPAWSQTDKNSSGQTQTSDDYRILTTAYSDEWLQQIATDFRSSDIYFRRRTQYGGWTGWRKFAMKDEVPTKVSQLTNDSGFSTLTLGTTSTTAAAGNHTHSYAGSSSAGGAATSANKVNKALTFNNGGQGVASGTTFDGSTARTISYNTIGAAAASHTHTKSQITDFPSSLPANGGNADTLDNLHASNFVQTSGNQTISGIKTFNAPSNTNQTEQTTMKLKTSNGGAIIFGKEGPNSGTMIRLDQADGTCRLRFRASNTSGAMVWEQPEKDAMLYVDLGNSAGTGVNRITFPSAGGTLALTSQIPSAGSAASAVVSGSGNGGSAGTWARADHSHGISKSTIISALGYTPPSKDTNTTYAIASGDSNGQIKVTPSSGSAYNVSVKGLGSAAYTASSAYLSSGGGKITGRLLIEMSNPHIHFKDTGYTTNWYLQAYQDTMALGPTYASALKIDKDGNTSTPGYMKANNFRTDDTTACIKPSDSNEINIGSNANYIYFGYENRAGTSGVVSQYYFGRHAGAGSAKDGDIFSGSLTAGRFVSIGSSTLQYDSTNQCLNFIFN